MTFATSKNLTVLGIVAIVQALAVAALAVFDGNPDTVVDFAALVSSIIGGVTAILAKGAASTGGSVAETPEAVARIAGK